MTETTQINMVSNLAETSTKINLNALFADRGNYINELSLFVAHFNRVPNLISEIDIDCKKANLWFEKHYETEIKNKYFIKRYFSGSEEAELDDIFYILFEDLVVNFDTNCSRTRFLFSLTPLSKVEALIQEVKEFKEKTTDKSFLHLMIPAYRGFDTKALEIPKPQVSISDNYNDDLAEVHRVILKRLSKQNDKGLILLHGKPGTGKTSYIRFLVSQVKKKVIFIPPNLSKDISSPDLISFLMDNPNCILVIEDAENMLVDRVNREDSPVSALLNISDGLLSDCLNIQMICSFNTDLSNVDTALLRKGRLIAKYEFRELGTEKASALSKKLGFKTEVNSPMSLTSIYNQEDEEYGKKETVPTIGFRTGR